MTKLPIVEQDLVDFSRRKIEVELRRNGIKKETDPDQLQPKGLTQDEEDRLIQLSASREAGGLLTPQDRKELRALQTKAREDG